MQFEYHGGQCCGIRHIFNFFTEGNRESDKTNLLSVIEDAETSFEDDEGDLPDYSHGNFPFGIEVVLTSYQAEYWREIVESVGFKEVFRFENGNTRNTCIVFFLNPANKEGE